MAEALAGRRILVTTDAVGGVWTYSLDLIRELTAAGINCFLAVLGPAPREDMLQAARAIPGVSVTVTGQPLEWLAHNSEEVLAAGREIASLAKAERCDLVQLHTAALAAAGGFEQPVVTVHHSCLATWWLAVRPGQELPEDFRWRSALVARGLMASDAVVTPTSALAHAIAGAYGLRSLPLTVRNGRSARQNESLPEVSARERFVLTSGRLWDEGKNAGTLDRAAARLAVPFLAVGPTAGPAGDKAQFRALRLTGAVSEHEMRNWVAGAPVYASAAKYEPFGLGVLEAAQAGCALVLSDIASFRELWSGACLFAPADDDAGFASAIARLLDEPPLLRRLAGRASHRARHYSAEAMAGEMMRIYSGLIAIAQVRRGAAA